MIVKAYRDGMTSMSCGIIVKLFLHKTLYSLSSTELNAERFIISCFSLSHLTHLGVIIAQNYIQLYIN